MAISMDVCDYVKNFLVKTNNPQQNILNQMITQRSLYEQAGFKEKSEELKRQIDIVKYQLKFPDKLWLNIPNFSDNFFSFGITKSIVLQWRKQGFFSSTPDICLFEVKPEEFTADIPAHILKATVEAKTLGLIPRVWFVSKVEDYQKYVREIRVDPAIVGYIKASGQTHYDSPAMLVGIWGKDIEEINKVFENEKIT